MDNTTSKADDAVPPGQTYTYTWRVPERAGPSETDNECITWSYYSHVNPTKDTNTGLIGPLIICRKASDMHCLPELIETTDKTLQFLQGESPPPKRFPPFVLRIPRFRK